MPNRTKSGTIRRIEQLENKKALEDTAALTKQNNCQKMQQPIEQYVQWHEQRLNLATS